VWRWRDLLIREVDATLDADRAAHVVAVREQGWLGFTDAEVARALLLRWWERSVGIPAEVSL
jgi:hypothetical protein